MLASRSAHGVSPAALAVLDTDVIESGDALGGEHGLVDHQGVLVDAVREHEAVVDVEVAAVGAVPHDGEHGEELRTFQRREHACAGALQHLGGRARLDTVVPVGADVVEQQDVGAACEFTAFSHRLKCAVGEGVVAVQEEDVCAARSEGADVSGLSYAVVLFQVHWYDAPVQARVLVKYAAAGVGRVVVDRDNFEVVERLGENGVQTCSQVSLNLVDGDDHAERRFGILIRDGHALELLGCETE